MLQGVRQLLNAIPYGTNEVYLHTDEALMPRNHATWASWNCIGSSDPTADTQAVCVTYWLNNLQVCLARQPMLKLLLAAQIFEVRCICSSDDVKFSNHVRLIWPFGVTLPASMQRFQLYASGF